MMEAQPIRTVTIDTNILSRDLSESIKAAAEELGFKVAATSVTYRETENGYDFDDRLEPFDKIVETAYWDESRWDESLWSSTTQESASERILQIITDNSFPPKKMRQNLSDGYKRQLRDAMIFNAHIRERRDIFVTNNTRDFIKDGRREKLEKEFNTKIMTSEEFLEFAKRAAAKAGDPLDMERPKQ
jgi:hypothetical protein